MKYFSGKLYINKEDYAILRYEQQYKMDYEFKNKRTQKGWGGSERNSNESSKVEIFTKKEEGYFLEYAKVVSNRETQRKNDKGKNEILKSKLIKEFQYFNITTKDVEPLEKNLLKFEKNIQYDPVYWEKFNLILKSIDAE